MKTILPVSPLKSASSAALPATKPCGSQQHGPITSWLTGLFIRILARKPANRRLHLLNQVRPVCNDVLEEQLPPAPVGLLGALLAFNGGIQ